MKKLSNYISILLLSLCFCPALIAAEARPVPAPSQAPPNHFTASWGERLKQGGPAAVVQIGLSVFGAAFVFERLFRLRRKNLAPERLADEARKLWRDGNFEQLEK